MTSKTSSNNLRGELIQTYLWDLKHRFGLIALFCGLHFISLPLVEILAMNSAQRSNLQYGTTTVDFDSRFLNVLQVALPLCTVSLTLLMALLLSVMAFQYMHQKRSVDLFHSLPVSRSALMGGRILSSLTALIIPLIVNFTFLFLIAAVFRLDFSVFSGFLFSSFGWIILMSAAAFLFCTVMAACSGTTFDMVISIVVISITYPLMIALGHTTAAMIIPGMTMDFSPQLTPYTALSPFVAAYIPMIWNSFQPQSHVGMDFLLWWIFMGIATAALALVLYRRRKSECAESNYAFPMPKHVIRFVATTAAGLAGGLIFQSVFSSVSGFFTGVFVASLVTHVIAEAIYGRGFKGLKKSFAYYGIFLVVFTAFYGICATGAFGFDTRAPKAEEVSYVETSLTDSGSPSGFSIRDETDRNQIAWVPRQIREQKNIEKIIQLQTLMSEEIRAKGYPYQIYDRYSDIHLVYHMKDGSVIDRTYPTELLNEKSQVNAAVKEITSTIEYRTSGNVLFYLTAENIESVYLYNSNSQKNALIPDMQKKQELLDALQKDMEESDDPYNGGTATDPLWLDLRISAITPAPDSELKKLVGDYNGKVTLSQQSIPVIDSMPRTKALVEKYGWDKTSTQTSATESSAAATESTDVTPVSAFSPELIVVQ